MAAISTKNRAILLSIPLGAGLLYLGSLVFDAPDAEQRPAPFMTIATESQTAFLDAEAAHIDVDSSLESIEYAPAREVYLETVLLHGGVGDRKKALLQLEQLATPGAISVMSLALADEDPRVRRAAFEALSRAGGDEALAAIASASADSEPATRAAAADALASTGGYSASAYLEQALEDPDPRVRAAAVGSLGDLNDSRSVNIISMALRDPDPEVRERAADLLDSLNDDALFHALYPAL